MSPACTNVSPCASLLTRTSASFHRVTAAASSTSCSMNTRSCSLQTPMSGLSAALHAAYINRCCCNAEAPHLPHQVGGQSIVEHVSMQLSDPHPAAAPSAAAAR